MEELFEHTEESRPRWWWLQAQNVGLFKNEAVEQKVVTSDSLKLKPDVIISGRVPELANAKVRQRTPFDCATIPDLSPRRSTECTCGSWKSAVGVRRTSIQINPFGSTTTRKEVHGVLQTL